MLPAHRIVVIVRMGMVVRTRHLLLSAKGFAVMLQNSAIADQTETSTEPETFVALAS
jgi:hypothetical protein